MMPAVHGSMSRSKRPGQRALKAFRSFQRALTPAGKKYAEAVWRWRRRAAVKRPDRVRYGVSEALAVAIEEAVDAIIRTHST